MTTERRHWIIAALLAISDAVAAALLAADLVVVCVSVSLRFLLNAPVEWSDDVARGLMVGSSFFGAASALARGDNPGVAFFIDRLPSRLRAVVESVAVVLMVLIAGYVGFNAVKMVTLTVGQTTGSGLPLELAIVPMVGLHHPEFGQGEGDLSSRLHTVGGPDFVELGGRQRGVDAGVVDPAQR